MIDSALSPIIGKRGVAALYKRSLHLARTFHPCLAAVYEGDLAPGQYAGLHDVLALQTSEVAAATHDGLLKTFRELLVNLIGPSLTDQLLRSVLDIPSSDSHSTGDAGQEASP